MIDELWDFYQKRFQLYLEFRKKQLMFERLKELYGEDLIICTTRGPDLCITGREYFGVN